MSTSVQSMELAELSQRLSFLDTERRKDKDLITTLMERLEAQTSKLDGQSRQIQELEGQLSSARAELTKFSQVESAMDQLRQELTLFIEANEEKRDKAYHELSRLRQVEQEAITRQLGEMRKDMEALLRQAEEIKGLRAEGARLHGSITNLQHQLAELDKRSEDRIQTVIYLEEQRRQDNRRIAQVEGDVTALRKQGDDLVNKASLLEQGMQAKNKKIDEAADLMERQAQLIENQRVAEFRWERQMAEWGKLIERVEQDAAEMNNQMMRTHEQHDAVRRALADLEAFRERIERRQSEISEMQRLAEDRQKRAMEEWQAEREKEKKLFNIENDERWRENARLNEKRDARLKALEDFGNEIASHMRTLWKVQEAWAQTSLSGARGWMVTLEEFVKERSPVPEDLKTPTPAPSQMPKIRPLPSAQATEDEETGE